MGVKEIAIKAGVSIGTVDRVLHHRGRVSEETKQKIEKLLQEFEYTPNPMARSLAVKNPKLVALLIPEPSQDEYWRQAWKGIAGSMKRAEAIGLKVAPYFYSLSNKNTFKKMAIKILKANPAGVIMAPNFLEEGKKMYEEYKKNKIPVIMFDTIMPDCEPLSYIGTDSFQSGVVAAELLCLSSEKKGRFILLHFDEDKINSPHMLEKERGFLSYIQKRDYKRKCQTIVIKDTTHSYLNKLQKEFEKDNPSGIFVSTSKVYKLGAVLKNACLKNAVIVGFDLITENIKLMQQGYIDFLINQNPGGQAASCILTFSSHLIYREAVKEKYFFPPEIVTSTNLCYYLPVE